MAQKNDTDFYVRNKSVALKREIVNIAKSEGTTYSQFIRKKLMEIRDSYPESKRNYNANDDGC